MILIILISFLALYVGFMIWLISGVLVQKKLSNFDFEPITFFSIIVPFRNEEHNLPNLLDSFSRLNYPRNLFEVILVDDQSDRLFEMGDFDFEVKIIGNIRHSKSPKKDTILTAIHTVSNDWIVTTDADCIVLPNWLLTFDNCIQAQNTKMIVGAVNYKNENTFLTHFQQIEFTSLQAVTMGSFGINHGFMCNGANFAYQKSFFLSLNGFRGNDHLASGDDVFLLQKALQFEPKSVVYLNQKSNTVGTFAQPSWRLLWHQRLRWASKATAYQSWFGFALSFIVFGCNAAFVAGFLQVVFEQNFYKMLLFCFLTKLFFDCLLLYLYEAKQLKISFKYLFISSLTYPFFAMAVAICSFFVKYEWKKRQF